MSRIQFDRQHCEGYFQCNAEDPEDFIAAEDGKSDLVNGREARPGLWEKDIGDDVLDLAKAAADVCPVNVIKVLSERARVLAGPDRLPIEDKGVEQEV